MKTATATTDLPCAERATSERRTFARRLRATFRSLFGGCGVTVRLRLLLFALLVPPPVIILYVLESRQGGDAGQLVALWLALSLILLKPLSSLAARWVSLGEINTINAFCAALRRGEYATRFALPTESEDEHELLRLKRDLNWLAHHIETRENWLRAMLDDTRERENHYKDLSRTDPLTGLANRRHFDTVLADMTGRRTRFALLEVDCDAFKTINDRYGHPAGDATLVALAQTLRVSVRESLDQAFRLGGDEFAVVLPYLDDDGALTVARRMRQRFTAANDFGATISIGVASISPRPGEPASARALVARCDAALYQAKASGGDQAVVAPATIPGTSPKGSTCF